MTKFESFKSQTKFIFSIDDFGVDPLIDGRILKILHKIDRISVFTNGPDSEFNQMKIKKLLNSGKALDLHLNMEIKFTKEKLKKKKLRGIKFLQKQFFLKNQIQEVEKRWTEQVERFIRIFERIPAGLNSHEHVHFFPPFFKIILKLKEKYKIPFLRFGRKNIVLAPHFVSYSLFILRKINAVYFQKNNYQTADYLLSLDWLTHPQKALKFQKKYLEIICHVNHEKEYRFLRALLRNKAS